MGFLNALLQLEISKFMLFIDYWYIWLIIAVFIVVGAFFISK